ncbi:MAG: DUF4097 family beta strand repeat protein [Treponema sp.]|nr:DUF4097 family beta strand repeat protein [Treponema sp.]
MKKLAVIILTATMIFHISAAQRNAQGQTEPFSPENTRLSQANYDSLRGVIPAYHFNPSFVKEINVSLEDENIEILPTENPFVKVDIISKEAETVPFYEVKGGELIVKSAKRKIEDDTVTVKVYIPKNHRAQGIFIQTKRGNIELHRQKAKKIDLETDRGTITLNGIDSKKLYVDSSHGDVKILDLTSEYAELDVSRHDLFIDKIKTTELSIDTSSGNVKASRIQTEKLSIDSTSGDITLQFASPISKNSSVYTKKGDIKIFKPRNSWCRYITSSKYGKFDNDFDSSDSNVKFSVESKNGTVSIIKK